MSFWNFLGGFALFNAVCDMFSSKPKRTYAPPQQLYHDYNHEDYPELGADESDIDALQNRVDKLQLRLDDTNVKSDHYDDLRDELDDLEFDRDIYDDQDEW